MPRAIPTQCDDCDAEHPTRHCPNRHDAERMAAVMLYGVNLTFVVQKGSAEWEWAQGSREAYHLPPLRRFWLDMPLELRRCATALARQLEAWRRRRCEAAKVPIVDGVRHLWLWGREPRKGIRFHLFPVAEKHGSRPRRVPPHQDDWLPIFDANGDRAALCGLRAADFVRGEPPSLDTPIRKCRACSSRADLR